MKASSMAVNQAKVDVAEQEKQGDIGKSLAERDRQSIRRFLQCRSNQRGK